MNLRISATSLLLALALCTVSPGCQDEEPDFDADTPLAGDAPVDVERERLCDPQIHLTRRLCRLA